MLTAANSSDVTLRAILPSVEVMSGHQRLLTVNGHCLQLKSCQVINGDSTHEAGAHGVRDGESALLLQDKALVGLSKVAKSLENKREALIHELDSLHRSNAALTEVRPCFARLCLSLPSA